MSMNVECLVSFSGSCWYLMLRSEIEGTEYYMQNTHHYYYIMYMYP